MKIGVDNALYMEKQTEQILNRVEQFSHKLYIEMYEKLEATR